MFYESKTANFLYPVQIENQRSKNGKPAIYLRLTVDYKRIELATQQYVDTQQWDHKAQCVKGKSEEVQTVNRQLTIMKADIQTHFNKLQALEKPITTEAIKYVYLGIGEKAKRFERSIKLLYRSFYLEGKHR